MNDPELTVPVTIVNTTSVNIASVIPVRKRLASGYAIAIFSTGASGRSAPSTRIAAPMSRSAL